MNESEFYELVVENLLKDKISKLQFEANEQWFITTTSNLYNKFPSFSEVEVDLRFRIRTASNYIYELFLDKMEEYEVDSNISNDEYDYYTESY